MDRAKIEAIIEEAYMARKAGDLDALVRMFLPDAVFRVAGSPDYFPCAVTAKGEAQIRRSVGALVREYQFFDSEPIDLVIDKDKAARRWRLKMRHLPTGEVLETEACDIWSFNNGKVSSLVQFFDTAAVAELTRGEGRAAFRAEAVRTVRPAGRPH